MWSGISMSRSAIDCRKVDCRESGRAPGRQQLAFVRGRGESKADLSAAVLSEETVPLAVAAMTEKGALISRESWQLQRQPKQTHLRVTSAFSTRTRPWNESEYESIRMSRPLASEASTPVADLRSGVQSDVSVDAPAQHVAQRARRTGRWRRSAWPSRARPKGPRSTRWRTGW
jgi:hypothetical protein